MHCGTWAQQKRLSRIAGQTAHVLVIQPALACTGTARDDPDDEFVASTVSEQQRVHNGHVQHAGGMRGAAQRRAIIAIIGTTTYGSRRPRLANHSTSSQRRALSAGTAEIYQCSVAKFMSRGDNLMLFFFFNKKAAQIMKA